MWIVPLIIGVFSIVVLAAIYLFTDTSELSELSDSPDSTEE